MTQLNPFLLRMVDEILFYEWDPIGVNGTLRTRDEYGNYAGVICRILHEGVNETKLAEHLDLLVREWMGLSELRPGHHKRIACRLLDALKSCEARDPYRSGNRRKHEIDEGQIS